jgi:hypothetical protein
LEGRDQRDKGLKKVTRLRREGAQNLWIEENRKIEGRLERFLDLVDGFRLQLEERELDDLVDPGVH